MERIRKEISKRRLVLEKKAETDAGIMAAWRKPKAVRIAPKCKYCFFEILNLSLSFSANGTKRLFPSQSSNERVSDEGIIDSASTSNKRQRLATNESSSIQFHNSSSTHGYSPWLPPKSAPTLAPNTYHREKDDKLSSSSSSVRSSQITNGKKDQSVSRIDLNKLHCICQTRYDESKYVSNSFSHLSLTLLICVFLDSISHVRCATVGITAVV